MIDLARCKQIERGDFVEYWFNEKLVACYFKDGWQMWFDDKGLLNRPDGPAVTKPDGSQFFYKNGELHRENGPAVNRSSGNSEYWVDGVKIKIKIEEDRAQVFQTFLYMNYERIDLREESEEISSKKNTNKIKYE